MNKFVRLILIFSIIFVSGIVGCEFEEEIEYPAEVRFLNDTGDDLSGVRYGDAEEVPFRNGYTGYFTIEAGIYTIELLNSSNEWEKISGGIAEIFENDMITLRFYISGENLYVAGSSDKYKIDSNENILIPVNISNILFFNK